MQSQWIIIYFLIVCVMGDDIILHGVLRDFTEAHPDMQQPLSTAQRTLYVKPILGPNGVPVAEKLPDPLTDTQLANIAVGCVDILDYIETTPDACCALYEYCQEYVPIPIQYGPLNNNNKDKDKDKNPCGNNGNNCPCPGIDCPYDVHGAICEMLSSMQCSCVQEFDHWFIGPHTQDHIMVLTPSNGVYSITNHQWFPLPPINDEPNFLFTYQAHAAVELAHNTTTFVEVPIKMLFEFLIIFFY